MSRQGFSFVRFGTLVDDSAFGPRFSGNLYSSNGNVATLRTTDMDDHGRISYDTMPLAEIKDTRLSHHFLQEGDLVITRSGTCGIAGVFDRFDLPVLPGAFLIRFRLASQANSHFFRYYFNSQIGRKNILSVARGAVQQNLTIPSIESLEVPLPTPKQQEQIAAAIEKYDALLENNQRRIALLERAARLLYEEWFVRFRFPGHKRAKFINGLPTGWKRRCVEDIAAFISRGITPVYDDEASCLVINQKCVRGGRLETDLARRQSKKVPEEKLVQFGDVLINSTGEGTLGRVAQVLEELGQCTVDSHLTIVRPKPEIGAHLFGMAFKQRESYLSGQGRGATNQTELSKDTIGALTIDVPPPELSENFETKAEAFQKAIVTLVAQNRVLASVRDLLLPRLMSGEVEV